MGEEGKQQKPEIDLFEILNGIDVDSQNKNNNQYRYRETNGYIQPFFL